MPGITGFISRRRTGDEFEKLNEMCNSMMHETFYDKRLFTEESLGIYACGVSIKGSFADKINVNSNENVIVLFSGECYPNEEDYSILSKQGYDARTDVSSYITGLYKKYGKGFVGHLNGWFSGLLIDLNKNKIFLFNDRFGIQRIYYHESEDGLYFSSEAKALLKVLPHLRSFDYKSLGEYFSFDSALEFRTLFSGINILEPGSLWSCNSASIIKEKYFNPDVYRTCKKLSPVDFFEELKKCFVDIMPSYLRGEKIGMSLTGGLDTRSILACDESMVRGIPCYTFASMYNKSLDSKVAKEVAAAISSEHESLILDNRFLDNYSEHVEKSIYITDGVADVCKADEIYMNKLARQIAPIRITGKFGSQVIRHLSVFRERAANLNLIPLDFQQYIDAGKETFNKYKNIDPLTFMLFIEIPQYWAGFTVSESSQLTIRSPYLDNRFVELLYMAPDNFSEGPERDFQWELIGERNQLLHNIMTDKGVSGRPVSVGSKFKAFRYQALNYIDKAYNIEKLPLSMHHKLSRLDSIFSFAKPQNAFAGYCNFRHYRLWFRTILSDYLQEILLDPKTLSRSHFNSDYIKTIVESHIKGRGNYLSDIRKVLTIELINRVLVEDI